MSDLIADDIYVCIDCYQDHHEGRPMKDNSLVTWTDNTNPETGEGIDAFSSSRCGCCGITDACSRYRMAVWE